jgi:stringent starvation protein B
VYIHLDPRRPGVHVPKWLAQQPQLVLQIGLNMAIAIPDLKVDDEGISCTLSFQRHPFWCRLPWASIWALVGESQRGMVWPDDVPPEVVAQQQQKAASAAQKPAKRPRPRLAAVGPDGRRSDAAAEAETDAGTDTETRADTGADTRADADADMDTGARAEAGADTGADATTGTRPPAGKPKRELPPYLRVIK